jgi:hypothetical protein
VYADVNGLTMFYEIRGTSAPASVPVVLLASVKAMAAIASSTGPCTRSC